MLKWIEREEHNAQKLQRKLEETNPGWFDQHWPLKQLPATCLTTQLDQAQRVTRRLKGLQAEPAFRFGFTDWKAFAQEALQDDIVFTLRYIVSSAR